VMVYVKYLLVGGTETTLVTVKLGALVAWSGEGNAETGPVPSAGVQPLQVSPLGQ
jgi:hypothetical protein